MKSWRDLVRTFGDATDSFAAAHPDGQYVEVTGVNEDQTVNVKLPHWSGSTLNVFAFDSTGVVAGQDSGYMRHHDNDTQKPYITHFAYFPMTLEDVNPPGLIPYPMALPLTGPQWAQSAHDLARTRNTGWSSLHWVPDPFGGGLAVYPLSVTMVCGPVRVWGNRMFQVVDGRDADSRVTSKVQLVDEQFSTVLSSQPNHFFLRIGHMNPGQRRAADQDSPDPPSQLAGNGDAGDFVRNLHLWDLKLNRQLGVCWEGSPGLVPFEMSLEPYIEHKLPYLPAVEERIYVSMVFAAPEVQPPGGRKPSRDRDDSSPHWLTEGGGRAVLVRLLVNFRRTYLFAQAPTEEAERIRNHPITTQLDPNERDHVLGLNSISLVFAPIGEYVDEGLLRGYLTVQERPSFETRFKLELPSMPLSGLIVRGEDLPDAESQTQDWGVVICGKNSAELEVDTELPCIERLEVIRVSLEGPADGEGNPDPGGVVLDVTPITLSAPSPDWPDEQDNFFARRPEDDVAASVPWFTAGFRFGDDFKAGLGLLRRSGYLLDFLVVQSGTAAARGDTIIIPRTSYGGQVFAIKITDAGSVSIAWTLKGWLGHPASTKYFTVCGIFTNRNYPEDGPLLLVHYEHFVQQSASSVFARRPNFVGHLAYQNAQGFPTPGSPDFFFPADWAPVGYTHPYQTDDPDGNTSVSEVMGRIMAYVKSYWEGRNDLLGWQNISTDQMRRARLQGFSVLNPFTGVEVTSDDVITLDSPLYVQSGNLIVEPFLSAPVLGHPAGGPFAQDPKDVADTHGPVFDWSDSTIGVSGTNEFGCVPPIGDDYVEIHRIVFLLEYPVRLLEEGFDYYDPIFKYQTADPSYDTGEPFRTSGVARVSLSLGTHFTQNGFAPDDPDNPRFGAVTWKRQFIVLRYKVAKAAYDYTNSYKIPFSLTKQAFIEEMGAQLMAQRAWPATPAPEVVT